MPKPTLTQTATTVLVPMLNLGVATDMIQLAGILAAGPRRNSQHPEDTHGQQPRVVVVGVVQVPPDQPLATGLVMARSYRALLDFLPSEVDLGRMRVRVDRIVKVARDVHTAVHDAANDEQAGLVLLYWKGYARQPKRHTYGSITDAILRHPPCDVALVRPESWHDSRRVLLPVRGGPSAERGLALALTLADHLHIPVSVMHNMPAPAEPQSPHTTQIEARGEEPFIVFNDLLKEAEKEAAVPVERILTAGSDPAASLIAEVRKNDFLIMGAPSLYEGDTRQIQNPKSKIQNPITLAVSEKKGPPLLLLHSPEPLDMADYKHRVRATRSRAHRTRKAWDDMPFENWFVENTFHGDEFKDPEAFLEAKRRSGLTISVALLTSNDAEHIYSAITGLKRVLVELHPIADQIAVIDAGSSDGTTEIARQLGVEVYSCADLLPEKGNLHGRGESWWKSLAVLRGDVLVWLDPRAQRFHPSTAISLAGPLLRVPTLQLAKAYGQPQPENASHAKHKGKAETNGTHKADGTHSSLKLGADYAPVDMSWGGFVMPRPGADYLGNFIRVQALKPEDLLALDAAQLASLPPRTILQVLSPSLAAVIAPFGRDMAGRRTAMLSLPAFTGENLEVGLLLSVAAEYGARAIAQVELRHGQPAPPPPPGLRNTIDLLQALSRRLQDAQMRRYAVETAERLQRGLQGPVAQPPDAAFEVRNLGPVERPAMQPILP
jgi:nucleotide-binding universal stress UspA family protein